MRRKAAEAATLARRWFMTTLGLAVTLVLGGSWYALFLSNRIVRPVRQVTEAASRMAAGDLDATVDVRATDEIGVLAAGFNAMAVADPRASPVRSREAARSAANGGGDDRLSL